MSRYRTLREMMAWPGDMAARAVAGVAEGLSSVYLTLSDQITGCNNGKNALEMMRHVREKGTFGPERPTVCSSETGPPRDVTPQP